MTGGMSIHPFALAAPAEVAASLVVIYGEQAITGARAAQKFAQDTKTQDMVEHWAEICAILEGHSA